MRYGLSSILGLVVWSTITILVPSAIGKLGHCHLPAFVLGPNLHRPGTIVDPGAACLATLPADVPIVVAPGFEYPSAWWYSTPANRSRTFFLTDMDYARQQVVDIHEVGLAGQREMMPMGITDYHEFLKAHDKFFVVTIDAYPDFNYTETHLRQDGYQFQSYPQRKCQDAGLSVELTPSR